MAAMRKGLAELSIDFADREPDVLLPAPNPRRVSNLSFFLRHDAPAVRRYRLDFAALEAAARPIVLAAGVASRHTWTHRCARALAERLGGAFAEFPGGHNGYVLRPRAFAARLRDVLAASSALPPQ